MNFNWKNLENNTIRRVLSWFGIGSSAFLFSACYGTPDDYYHTLSVFPGYLELPSDAGKLDSVELYTEGTWEIVEIPSFVTVQPTQGARSATIYVTTSEKNDQQEARGDYMRISGNGMAVSVAIVQQSDKADE